MIAVSAFSLANLSDSALAKDLDLFLANLSSLAIS